MPDWLRDHCHHHIGKEDWSGSSPITASESYDSLNKTDRKGNTSHSITGCNSTSEIEENVLEREVQSHRSSNTTQYSILLQCCNTTVSEYLSWNIHWTAQHEQLYGAIFRIGPTEQYNFRISNGIIHQNLRSIYGPNVPYQYWCISHQWQNCLTSSDLACEFTLWFSVYSDFHPPSWVSAATAPRQKRSSIFWVHSGKFSSAMLPSQ